MAQNPATRSIPALLAAVGNIGLPQAQRDVAKVLLEHALKTSDLPPDQKDYILTRAQGSNKTFEDYQLGLKRAGATLINTQEGMDAAQTKARIAIDTHAVQDLSKKAVAGRSAIPVLERFMQIADKTPEGWAGAASPLVAKALSSLGIEVPQGASNAELMVALSRQFIPAIRDPGATSNYEQSLYTAAVPGLVQSADGRMKIARMFRAQIERNGEILKVYRQNIGSPDLDKKLAELDAKPMFADEDRRVLESIVKQQPNDGGTGAINSAPPQNAPIQGAKQAPNGKWYVDDPGRPGKYLEVQP
jgi:hypothetical protein